MKKLASNLPLQDMITSVIARSTEKLAADESQTANKVKKLLDYEKKEHGHIPTAAEEEAEKKASDTTTFVEKLASTCDFIAENINSIEYPIRGTLQKAAEGVGSGRGEGALAVSKAIGGEQSHKKNKPKGEDAAASQASTGLSAGGLPGGKTQLDNNMHKAPGQSSGSVPKAKYPVKGPLVANPTVKHAGVRSIYTAAVGGVDKVAQARQRILAKLAGEDVLKANIDGGGAVGVLGGKGQLKTTAAGEASPRQSGDQGGGYGNQARSHLASSSAAINMTKRDAKGPVKTQLKEVLEEPALSSKTDSKLQDNLRNTGKAGVKIAAAKAALRKIAQAGCQCDGGGECHYCQLQSAMRGREKVANMGMGGMGGAGMPPKPMGMKGGGMGGGMTAMADAGAGADGCTCGGTGECRVCKLKAALSSAKGAGPVEKDSTGDLTQPGQF